MPFDDVAFDRSSLTAAPLSAGRARRRSRTAPYRRRTRMPPGRERASGRSSGRRRWPAASSRPGRLTIGCPQNDSARPTWATCTRPCRRFGRQRPRSRSTHRPLSSDASPPQADGHQLAGAVASWSTTTAPTGCPRSKINPRPWDRPRTTDGQPGHRSRWRTQSPPKPGRPACFVWNSRRWPSGDAPNRPMTPLGGRTAPTCPFSGTTLIVPICGRNSADRRGSPRSR